MFNRIKFLSRSRYFPRMLQRKHMLNEAADQHYDTIVDVGGGQSKYIKILKCNQYITTDIEDRIGDGSVVIADANIKLPFNNEFADLIICTEVLEHLHSPGVALSEMFRVLKPGGKIVITVPFVWPEHEVPVDFYRYTQWGLLNLMQTAGFERIKIKNTNCYSTTILCLLVSKFRHPLWAPIVLIINVLIVLIHKFSKTGNFPLSVHSTAYKLK